jgi:lysophospholipase L1-like esterase
MIIVLRIILYISALTYCMKKRLLLSCLILILIGVNSCKKEYRDPLPDVATHATVSAAEILDFFNQNPNVEPAGILLSQAEQQTVNGKQVVRIPVATNAALYFTKENDSLKVYAYKWVYNAPYSDKYTGKIDIYNFQEQNFKRYTYNNASEKTAGIG